MRHAVGTQLVVHLARQQRLVCSRRASAGSRFTSAPAPPRRSTSCCTGRGWGSLLPGRAPMLLALVELRPKGGLSDPIALFRMASARRSLGHHPEALTAISHALELLPGDPAVQSGVVREHALITTARDLTQHALASRNIHSHPRARPQARRSGRRGTGPTRQDSGGPDRPQGRPLAGPGSLHPRRRAEDVDVGRLRRAHGRPDLAAPLRGQTARQPPRHLHVSVRLHGIRQDLDARPTHEVPSLDRVMT